MWDERWRVIFIFKDKGLGWGWYFFQSPCLYKLTVNLSECKVIWRITTKKLILREVDYGSFSNILSGIFKFCALFQSYGSPFNFENLKWLNSPPNILFELNNFRNSISPTICLIFVLGSHDSLLLPLYFGKRIIYAIGNSKCW